jgi:membrane protease YdiL (CAAX protease family)
VGLVLALLVIVGSIVFVLQSEDTRKAMKAEAPVRPSTLLNMMARYLMGAQDLLKKTHQWNDLAASNMTKDLDTFAKTPSDELCVEIVRGALMDRKPDADALAKLVKTTPSLQADVDALAHADALSAEQWKAFLKRHGWIARLARAQASDWKHEDWPVMLGEAHVTTVAFAGTAMMGFGAFIAGIVALVMILRRWKKGLLPVRLTRPDAAWAPCFIEGFAIYLGTFAFALFQLHACFPQVPRSAFYIVALVFIVLAMFWPRLRGMDRHAWRQVMGFHRGAGVLREMGFGVLGWIAGLPLLAIGAGLAAMISKWTGQIPTHPIVDDLAQPGWGRWSMIALAVIWAPLTEETMFRGLLFPGFAKYLCWIPGALLGAFVFAVIHPQGWAGVPAIMAIAITMSALRSFRGSLIAPMTAHALNNGVVTLMLLAAS